MPWGILPLVLLVPLEIFIVKTVLDIRHKVDVSSKAMAAEVKDTGDRLALIAAAAIGLPPANVPRDDKEPE